MPANITRIPRAEFLESGRFSYAAGEHVTVLGPTGSGKTTLTYQLLDLVATPRLPGLVLVMKPKDSTASRWNKSLGFKRISTWPPIRAPFAPRPRGYTLWPKHSGPTVGHDNMRMLVEFDKALNDSYRKGNRILFADEVVGLSDELGLKDELNAIWTRGRAMGTGLWAASQRPFYVPLNAYAQSQHLFLHNDPDKRNRDRFREIGGVDPELVAEIIRDLPLHHFLYIRRRGPAMCVVEA